jgi:succinyl-diaminopimelate desuccinylase
MFQSVEQGVCKRILNLKDELVSLLWELIAAPTPDPPGDNYDDFARIPYGYMEALGAKVSIVQAPPELLPRDAATGKTVNRPNILAEIEGSKKAPILHLNGHYDVVPAMGDWTSDPYKPEIRKGRIYGRGAHDMKSVIAAMMVAAKALS